MSRTVLVIGGTGPTGPDIVAGLVGRGYRVTLLHGGFHEAPLEVEPDEHLHADPHFAETLADALGDRCFDMVIATYGRLRIIAEHFRGRTGRLIGIGSATGSAAHARDPRWGVLGRPVNLREEWNVRESEPGPDTLSRKIAAAEASLLEAGESGAYDATYLGYATLYGPRQPAPFDWCIIRRLLDGRTRLVIADGGLKIESRLFTKNAAHAVLCAVDRPEAARNRSFYLADERQFTMRQRIEAIAAYLGRSVELVDLPYDMAKPCYPYWRHEREHRYRDARSAQIALGYRDLVTPEDALVQTIDWLLRNPPEPGGEIERKLGDPFNYQAEDELLAQADQVRAALASMRYEVPEPVHQYRHPSAPGEAWKVPERRDGPTTEGLRDH